METKLFVLSFFFSFFPFSIMRVLLIINFFLIHRNIVSTVNLGCKLDLKKIALHARNAEYNPKVQLFFLIFCYFC